MPMPPRFTKVGPKEAAEHSCLPPDVPCFFWGEYTPHEHTGGKLNDYSPTNRLIGNFKKGMNRRGQADWRYKIQAIDDSSEKLANAFKWSALVDKRVVLIPMPPSKPRDHALYDDRVSQVVQQVVSKAHSKLESKSIFVDLQMRDCLRLNGSIPSSHSSTTPRPSASDVFEAMHVDTESALLHLPPQMIFVFDDVLTTGAHFSAAYSHLHFHFPQAQIVGIFLARTVRPVWPDVNGPNIDEL